MRGLYLEHAVRYVERLAVRGEHHKAWALEQGHPEFARSERYRRRLRVQRSG